RRRRRDVPPHDRRSGGGGPPSAARRWRGLAPPPAPSTSLRLVPLPRSKAAREDRMTAPFPTHKQEEWRYADLDALRPVWQQFAEPVTLIVGPGESFEKIWLSGDEAVQVRRVHIALEKDAKARIFVLNTASEYGRVELEMSL